MCSRNKHVILTVADDIYIFFFMGAHFQGQVAAVLKYVPHAYLYCITVVQGFFFFKFNTNTDNYRRVHSHIRVDVHYACIKHIHIIQTITPVFNNILWKVEGMCAFSIHLISLFFAIKSKRGKSSSALLPNVPLWLRICDDITEFKQTNKWRFLIELNLFYAEFENYT